MTIECQSSYLYGLIKTKPQEVLPATVVTVFQDIPGDLEIRDLLHRRAFEVIDPNRIVAWHEAFSPRNPEVTFVNAVQIKEKSDIHKTSSYYIGKVIGTRRLYTWKPTSNPESQDGLYISTEELEKRQKLQLAMAERINSIYGVSALDLWNLRGKKLIDELKKLQTKGKKLKPSYLIPEGASYIQDFILYAQAAIEANPQWKLSLTEISDVEKGNPSTTLLISNGD